MNKRISLFFFLLAALLLHPRLFAQQLIKGDNKAVTYNEEDLLDPDYGIKRYDKLNFYIGGDSVRNTTKGYACQGWFEDNYVNGQLLHRGFYVDGQLRTYKNFYDNGQLEREFKLTDLHRASMKIFYKDGKPKADIEYSDGNTLKEQDYYSNGNLKYVEEHTKNMEYLLQMNFYTDDGKPQSLFEVTDKKKKIYYKKEYNENGTIKEEGPMKYSSDAVDYMKDGIWKFYDENGNLKSTDTFVNGQGGNAN